MRKARHHDIASRLEATKQLGFVEDYRIDWQAQSLRGPRVTIKSRASLPSQITRNYVAALLDRLVPSREIVIVPGG